MAKWSLILLLSFGVLAAQAATLEDLATIHFEKIEQGISISVYELQNQASYFEPAVTHLTAIAEFQRLVEDRTPTNPYFLLRRQRDVFLRHGMKELEPKFQQALQQPLLPLSFLEEMFFELHQEKVQKPLLGSYSEFGAHVLVGPQDQLVVIFVSNPHDAMVPEIKTTTELLVKYLGQGFTYYAFVHNHPFNFENPVDSGGTTIPSGNAQYGDVSAFILYREKYGLKNAWITNGFNSIRIPSSDFEKY